MRVRVRVKCKGEGKRSEVRVRKRAHSPQLREQAAQDTRSRVHGPLDTSAARLHQPARTVPPSWEEVARANIASALSTCRRTAHAARHPDHKPAARRRPSDPLTVHPLAGAKTNRLRRAPTGPEGRPSRGGRGARSQWTRGLHPTCSSHPAASRTDRRGSLHLIWACAHRGGRPPAQRAALQVLGQGLAAQAAGGDQLR